MKFARRAAAAVLTLGAAVTSVMCAAPASAAPAQQAADCSQAFLGPQNASSTHLNYFNITVEAGQRRTERLVAANPTDVRCVVTLTRAYGRTAVNSGDTYVNVGSTCEQAACWLSGVPESVSIPPRSRVTVPFTVSAPAAAKSGEYLAGVVGEPSDAAGSGHSKDGVVVKVRSRVAIGVAITVPGALRPELRIPRVTVEDHQSVTSAGVAITEVNTGNTWEHPKGAMTIALNDRKVRLPITSDTVLGGGSALLRAGVGKVAGRHLTRVELWYDNHTKVAVWQGILTFPTPPTVTRTGNQLVVSPQNVSKSLPAWVWAVLGGAGFLLLLVVGLLLLLFRKRRRDDGDDNDDADRANFEPTPDPTTDLESVPASGR